LAEFCSFAEKYSGGKGLIQDACIQYLNTNARNQHNYLMPYDLVTVVWLHICITFRSTGC